MNQQELQTVIAALRFFQANPLQGSAFVQEGEPLENDSINKLCERLVEGEGKSPRVLINVGDGQVKDVYVDGGNSDYVYVLDWDTGDFTLEDVRDGLNAELFVAPNGEIGNIFGARCHSWEELDKDVEMSAAVDFADGNREAIPQLNNADCVEEGCHLKSCDDDGFCNFCGEQ